MKTFPKGGVHPPENKISAAVPIEMLPIPETVIIHLSQHLGAPAQPVVEKGEQVKVGQLIAKSAGFVSAPNLSPVSGTIEKIEAVPDTSGYKKPAIIIMVEGDEWIDTIDRSPDLFKEITLS